MNSHFAFEGQSRPFTGREQNLLSRRRIEADTLFRLYSQDVANYVRGYRGVRYEDAEEIAVDTLLTALELAPTLGPTSCVRSWLFGIARLRVADHFRKSQAARRPHERNRVASIEDFEGEQGGPLVHDPVPAVVERLHYESLVRAAFSNLSRLERQVLIDHYIVGKSIQELAQEYERSPKAVECLLTRAKARARVAVAGADSNGVDPRRDKRPSRGTMPDPSTGPF